MPAIIPTAPPVCLKLRSAPFEAVGAFVLELEADGAAVVEVAVVSVVVDVGAEPELGLALVTRVEVDGGGAAVPAGSGLVQNHPRLWVILFVLT